MTTSSSPFAGSTTARQPSDISGASSSAAPAETGSGASALPALTISENRRFIVTEEGRPFFWLGDTAWELFHRTDRAEAVAYLDNRAAKGFNVIQAAALAELDGIDIPNVYGKFPLADRDPSRPAVEEETEEEHVAPPSTPPRATAPEGVLYSKYDYWDHVEFIVDETNRRGIYIGFLPTWGAWVQHATWKPAEPRDIVFNEDNARVYGEFVGRRFGRKGIVWILGGDRPADGREAVTRAMAAGVAAGVAAVGGPAKPLMTFHPQGGETSSRWFHDDEWLSFNMWQTGHGPIENDLGATWNQIGADYARQPVKPVLDGEPLYEDHPTRFSAEKLGYSSDAHVRQRAWWGIMAGGCGVTYGNHAVWQMFGPGRKPINGPLMYWQDALDRPGAGQMRHLRALIESRPMPGRVPDQSLVSDALAGNEHIAASRGGDYAFVYTAEGKPFRVNLGKTAGTHVVAWWFNPRSGTAERIGVFENKGFREFAPPVIGGVGADFVLVLDDTAAGFGEPGAAALPAAPRDTSLARHDSR